MKHERIRADFNNLNIINFFLVLSCEIEIKFV